MICHSWGVGMHCLGLLILPLPNPGGTVPVASQTVETLSSLVQLPGC